MGDSVDQLLRDLLTRLEVIGDRDESLYDTEVREMMGDAIFLGFIKPQPDFVLPDDYGMPDDENGAIKEALRAYIGAARVLAPTIGLDTFHKRLAAFQNSDIRTARKKGDYEDFFGWCNPELFDESGNVTRLY